MACVYINIYLLVLPGTFLDSYTVVNYIQLGKCRNLTSRDCVFYYCRCGLLLERKFNFHFFGSDLRKYGNAQHTLYMRRGTR
jgi:hypothetical protein